ncbi:F0F1 ATP synthase subunit A [PVC group bacterium]|nr:F0F1 ATP synthase subunit A [PVC group bacterium]
MHEISREVLICLPTVLGVDLSITNEVLLLWISASAAFVLVTFGCRYKGMVPKGRFQNMFEAIIEFIETSVVKEGIGKDAKIWSPFLLSLFFFVLFSNFGSMVPLPSHSKAMTSNINVTGALAFIVFALTLVINLRKHGIIGFFRKFVPSGLPVPVALFAVPIEIISWLARPFSLAIRLFANMMAGHALILVFLTMAGGAAWFLKVLPFTAAVIMSAFELFVCFVQAFIFTLLSGIYIKDALESH